jgi:single-stranded-DNA-specific exonuclease
VTPQYKTRISPHNILDLAQQYSITELQARIVANRCASIEQLDKILNPSLKNLVSPALLIDSDKAVKRIVQAIKNRETIGLLTDYDVDGITSHAILFFALRDYFNVPETQFLHLIGHRIDDGYGISQGLVERILAMDKMPDLIITADCGSSDETRISQLNQQHIDVIVTDHHVIPQQGIPQSAFAIVNPTREDCEYPDSSIAGCMVSWLLMSLLRSELISCGLIEKQTPKLSALLDFVSLGTVADAVSLSGPINRAVVKTGLEVINQLKRPCWQAMKKLLNREFELFTTEDLGFQIGPRINARSRMSDPYAALYYLSAPSLAESMQHLNVLDQDNQQRKDTEKEMLVIAVRLAKQQLKEKLYSLVIYHEEFHPGVQGIVAARLLDKFGRPVIVLSPTRETGLLSGSARTIASVHILQAIKYAADKMQGVRGFGGHKGAAGLKLETDAIDQFRDLFEQAVEEQLGLDNELRPIISTDGELAESALSFQTIAELKQLEPYGREFEAPVFEGEFLVQSIRAIGVDGTHLMIQLATDTQSFRAVWFRALVKKSDPFPFVEGQLIKAVYQLKENYYRGNFSIQLHIIHAGL